MEQYGFAPTMKIEANTLDDFDRIYSAIKAFGEKLGTVALDNKKIFIEEGGLKTTEISAVLMIIGHGIAYSLHAELPDTVEFLRQHFADAGFDIYNGSITLVA